MRQPGAPPACDMCGSTVRVGAVVHRQMVPPNVKDTCALCSKRNALAYYRNGGAPIYARRATDSETEAGQAPASGGLDVGPTSRKW